MNGPVGMLPRRLFFIFWVTTLQTFVSNRLPDSSDNCIKPCMRSVLVDIQENSITKDLSLNPSVTHIVTCDVSAYPSDQLAYQWYRNGTRLSDTSRSISISSMSNMASEPLVCMASVGCYSTYLNTLQCLISCFKKTSITKNRPAHIIIWCLRIPFCVWDDHKVRQC